MFGTTLIVALALTGQAKTPAEQRALIAAINAKNSTPEAQARIRSQQARERASRDESLASYEAQRPAREAAARARYEAMLRARERAMAEHMAMVPYMLEGQRQMLNRMSDIERNAALNRLAGAAEYEAETDRRRAFPIVPAPVPPANFLGLR